MKKCQLKTRNDANRVMCSVRKQFVLLSDCDGCELDLGEVVIEESQVITEKKVVRYPSITGQAWNLAVALTQFAGSGFKIVSKDEYARRLTFCDACAHRDGWQCLPCGCIISFKAHGRVWKCPLGYWT